MKYQPPPLPKDPAQLVPVLQNELRRIANILNRVAVLDQSNIEPPDKQNGMIAYADGTNWNPGSGAGIYFYNGTTWTKL